MQPMTAHQGEERREEGAAGRPVAAGDQAVELVQLEQQNTNPNRPVMSSEICVHFMVALTDRDAGHAAGEAGGQQAGGFEATLSGSNRSAARTGPPAVAGANTA